MSTPQIMHCLNCNQDYDFSVQGAVCPHETGDARKDRLPKWPKPSTFIAAQSEAVDVDGLAVQIGKTITNEMFQFEATAPTYKQADKLLCNAAKLFPYMLAKVIVPVLRSALSSAPREGRRSDSQVPADEFCEPYLAAIERKYPPDSIEWRLVRQLRERTAERNSYDSQRKYLLKKLAALPSAPYAKEPE